MKLQKPINILTFVVLTIAAMLFGGSSARAASQTWTNAPQDANWTNVLNWNLRAYPGATNLTGNTVNGDVATFTNPVVSGIGDVSNPIHVADNLVNNGNRGLQISGITFDTTNCGAYVFNGTTPNVYPSVGILFVSHNGSIAMNPGVTNSQTFLLPVDIRLPSSTDGIYNFVNNSSNSAAVLFFNAISNDSANTRGTTFILDGSNTGTNTIESLSKGTTTTGGMGLTKQGKGRWLLPNANDLASQSVNTIQDGTLEVQNAGSLGAPTSATITSNGVLQVDAVTLSQAKIILNLNGKYLANGSQTLNSVSIGTTVGGVTTPSLATTSSGDILTVGPVTNGASDSIVHVSGPGTVLLNVAPPVSSYIGKWSFDAGTTKIGTTGVLGSGSLASVGPGAFLDASPLGAVTWTPGVTALGGTGSALSGSSAATITADPGATINLVNKGITVTFTPTSFSGDTTHPSFIVSSGTLAIGTTTFTVNNASGTALGAGTYLIAKQSSGSVSDAGSHVVSVTGSGLASGMVASIQTSGGNVNLIVIPYVPKNLTWTGGNPNSTWDISAANWLDGVSHTAFSSSDNVTFNSVGSTNPTVTLSGTLLPSSVTVDTAANTYTFSGGGQISGSTALAKASSGTLVLSTVNSYTGGTTITNGVLQIGVNNAVPSSGGVTTVNSTATLDLNGLNDSIGFLAGSGIVTNSTATASTLTVGNNDTTGVFSGTVSGLTSLTKTGTGTETLNGVNTYIGTNTINNGTVTVGNASGLGSSTNPVIVNVGTLNLATSTTIGSLSGTGGTVANNSSASPVSLTVQNPVATTYSGNIVDGSGGGAVSVRIVNGASLTFAGTANTFSGGAYVGTGSTFAIPNSPASVGGFIVASNGATISLSGGSATPGTPTNVTTVDGATVTVSSGAEGKIWQCQWVGGPTATNRFTTVQSVGQPSSFANFLGVVQLAGTGSANFRFFNGGGTSGGDNTTFEFDGSNVHTRDAQTVSLGAITGGSISSGIGGQGAVVATYIIGAKGVDTSFSGYISGSNNIVKTGAGTLTLIPAQFPSIYLDQNSDFQTNFIFTNMLTYIGNTTISNGVLNIIAPNTVTNSPTITLAGSSAVLDARSMGYATYDADPNNGNAITNSTVFTNSTLEMISGQTLAGVGTIRGKLLLDAGSTNNVGLSTGMLTVTSNATLAGVINMNLNTTNTPNSSELACPGTITIAGTAVLNVVNVGPALTTSTTFQLFSHAVSGTFAATNLPAVTPPMYWTNRLAVDGSISLINPVNTTPTNITVSVSSGNINLSWPTDHTGWTLQAQTNSLTKGLSTNDADWFDVPGSSGVNSTSIPINTNTNGAVFYRLKL